MGLQGVGVGAILDGARDGGELRSISASVRLAARVLTLGGSGEVAHLRIERIDGPLRATPGANALQHDCHVSLQSKAILALCGERDPLAIHLSAADPSLGNGDAHERIGIYRIGILFKDRQIGKFARL